MKGLLFTELLEMVEEDFGYHTANDIVLRSNLSSGGIYTASRRYHRAEMSVLFEQLHQQTKVPFEQLSAAFGRRLCRRITQVYPQHKTYVNRIFAMISKRSTTPVFQYVSASGSSLTVLYHPQANAACLADGMIKGYLHCLQQMSSVEETIFADGRRKFVLTLN